MIVNVACLIVDRTWAMGLLPCPLTSTVPSVCAKAMSRRAATRLRLEETSGMVMYSDLKAHLERDAVFVVAPALSLIECAVAVAMDDVDVVQGWIEGGALRKPSRKERERWPKDEEQRWRAVVVQPFVLIQQP